MCGSDLEKWVEITRGELEEKGYSIEYRNHDQQQSSVDIDGSRFIGTITHWPDDLYEIQFNDVLSGEVVVLETARLENVEHLTVRLRLLGII